MVSANSVDAPLSSGEIRGLSEQHTDGGQTASEATESKIQELLEKTKRLTGIDSAGALVVLVTILFYLALIVFLILWMIEKSLNLGRKIVRRPYKEYRGKKVFRVVFTASLIGKFAVLCLAVAGIFSQALATSYLFEKYIQQPENLWELVRNNKAFLVIFGVVVIAEIYRFRRRRKRKMLYLNTADKS